VPGPTPEIVEDVPIRVGGPVSAPELIKRINPEYPEVARKARIQGVVILEAIIDKEGSVTNVRVLRGLPMGLSDAAQNALMRWKFKPAMMNNRPVSVYYTLTVTFTLQ